MRTDITDDKNAADSFRLLFENNPVPMWVVEKSTLHYIDVNAAALELYGYTREDFLKMTFAGYSSPERIPAGLDDAQNNFLSTAAKRTGPTSRPMEPKSWSAVMPSPSDTTTGMRQLFR